MLAKGSEVNEKGNNGWAPLHIAARYNRTEIAELLISKGADVNIMSGSDNALTIAQKKQFTEIVDILVKNGAKEPSPEDLMGDR